MHLCSRAIDRDNGVASGQPDSIFGIVAQPAVVFGLAADVDFVAASRDFVAFPHGTFGKSRATTTQFEQPLLIRERMRFR
jgi:hypothetical protein